VRCHLGVAPQERTAEEHNTRGPRTTLATFGRGTSGGTVSRVWSLWTVQCEGGTYLARTLTTSGLPKRSSTSCWPESMDGDARRSPRSQCLVWKNARCPRQAFDEERVLS
jgi:hypothetical protein